MVENYFRETENMPKREFTNDDYWAMPQNELARNGFEYCSGLLCGLTKPRNSFPSAGGLRWVTYPSNPQSMVYANFGTTRVFNSSSLQQAAYNIFQEEQEEIPAFQQYVPGSTITRRDVFGSNPYLSAEYRLEREQEIRNRRQNYIDAYNRGTI